jgi:hypothetical protein
MVAEVVTFTSLLKNTGLTADRRPLAMGDCVIGYGTFPFARQIQLHRRWIPGAWCDPANLDCTTYYGHFGKFLLNQHYAIMPGVEAIRQQDWLYEICGPDGEVFARPTGCNNVFTGRCVYKDDFSSALGPTRYDPATLVVIAPPKEIEQEWRLVVAGDKVVASSRYAVCGSKDVEQGSPEEVRSFAETMLSEVRWRPDPIFMMDVCESDGRLWLVELNGFSTSWLEACHLTAVVEVASESARGEWEKAERQGG